MPLNLKSGHIELGRLRHHWLDLLFPFSWCLRALLVAFTLSICIEKVEESSGGHSWTDFVSRSWPKCCVPVAQ